ncbi:MAG: hypothetical protein ACI308_02800 [Muribaculaceae bacterium]
MTSTSTTNIFAERNQAIDMLRAITMFTMIFVNDFWKIHGVPHWLEHAAIGEDFMGLADVVFPCFLFAVGMSIPYAIERRYAKGCSPESTVGHILTRSLWLIVIGCFIGNSESRLAPDAPYSIGVYWLLMAAGIIAVWNSYPTPKTSRGRRLIIASRCIGAAILIYLIATFRNPQGGSFSSHSSILGLIGWAYLVCAMAYFFVRNNLRVLIVLWAVAMLLCMLYTPLRECYGGTSLLNTDRGTFMGGMLGILHIGNSALVALTMSGMLLSLIGARLMHKSWQWKMRCAIAVSATALLAGIAAHRFWIVGKIEATPVWVFYIIAISVTLYTALHCLSQAGFTRWFAPLRPAGTATLTVYLMPYVFYACSELTGVVLPHWLTHGFMGIVNCLVFSLVVITVTGVLERLHIKLKI